MKLVFISMKNSSTAEFQFIEIFSARSRTLIKMTFLTNGNQLSNNINRLTITFIFLSKLRNMVYFVRNVYISAQT